jgi:hypothetical protein
MIFPKLKNSIPNGTQRFTTSGHCFLFCSIQFSFEAFAGTNIKIHCNIFLLSAQKPSQMYILSDSHSNTCISLTVWDNLYFVYSNMINKYIKLFIF